MYILFSNFCTFSPHFNRSYRILVHVKNLLNLPNSKVKKKRFRFCLRIRMPRLSEEQRNRAVGMLMAGSPSMTFLKRLAARGRPFTCYVHNGTVRDCQRPGMPRATTTRTDRFITLTHLLQRFLPATVIARHYGWIICPNDP